MLKIYSITAPFFFLITVFILYDYIINPFLLFCFQTLKRLGSNEKIITLVYFESSQLNDLIALKFNFQPRQYR